MNRILIISLVLLVGFVSCKNAEKAVDKLKMAENYFEALNASNSSKMKDVLADSLIITIPKYEYEVRYSKKDYLSNWLKWDSVFEPTYEVLEMNLHNGSVKAKVSKSDKRIFFFMQKPFLTNYSIRFENNKIIAVEEEALNFDEATWERNRTELLNWNKAHHPKLNLDHYINEQTASGGMKLLKAIEFYKNKE
ncbi:hypothetical protein [Winogradskyella alexanderae]|uniref:Lipoprotein n=1 Tax=Winogradskyella alexanderae TaxID=2877123 RepID=A0ABS7XTE7_9FLAO|nr:hypothetical protein [Winogradskyella alexanderae]MCA0132749.1 hypothetical protein [Winogradskyella alexanderae]